MIPNVIELYVSRLNEGADVLRPATGLFVGPDVVRIEALDDYDPDIEEWEFPPGSEVRCIAEFREGREILVARSRVEDASSAGLEARRASRPPNGKCVTVIARRSESLSMPPISPGDHPE